ncbi:MAG TPA: hypothetical protein VMT52_01550 [Planctomycetota bacterium]|nr:hypothetical protein [Planctomycetota bacterium]
MRTRRSPSLAKGLLQTLLSAWVFLAGPLSLSAQEAVPGERVAPGAADAPKKADAPRGGALLDPSKLPPGATTPPAPPLVVPANLPGTPGTPPTAALRRTSDPAAVAIIETYLKAIGGREILSKIKDRVTKFSNVKHAPTGETVADINLLIKDEILIREEWDIKGFDIKGSPLAFVQIYNGHQEEGWVQMLGTVSPLDGRTLQVFVWDKQVGDFFYRWEEDGYTLSLVGQGIVPREILGEEQACDVVQVADFSGRQQMKFFFSKKDGLLLKKEWQDTASNPKNMAKKEQYYKMYRDITFMDGSGLAIKFPLRLEIYLDGDLDTERIFTNVRFNSLLSDKLFDKPEGVPFTGAVYGPTPESEPPKEKAPHGKRPHGSAPKVKKPGSDDPAPPTDKPLPAPVEAPKE